MGKDPLVSPVAGCHDCGGTVMTVLAMVFLTVIFAVVIDGNVMFIGLSGHDGSNCRKSSYCSLACIGSEEDKA